MPDVWTSNPEKLRRILSQEHVQGIRCGENPRVLTDRDPQWTCVMEWDTAEGRWLGDIYIHDLRELFLSVDSPYLWAVGLVFFATVAMGILIGRIAYRR